MTFKEAFAKASKAGKKTFMWNGERYTTEKASASAPKTSPRPKKPSGAPAGKRAAAKARKTADEVKSKYGPGGSRSKRSPRPQPRPTDPDKIKKIARKQQIRKWQEQEKEDRIKRAPKSEKGKSDMTFKEAFAKARKAGKKTFMWKGDKYTTEVK